MKPQRMLKKMKKRATITCPKCGAEMKITKTMLGRPAASRRPVLRKYPTGSPFFQELVANTLPSCLYPASVPKKLFSIAYTGLVQQTVQIVVRFAHTI
jgi:ssDNA-binding Zn-finger/Zn-ribbon topoisomerase 1